MDREQIEKLARLAKIELTEQEKQNLEVDMNNIIELTKIMDDLDFQDVPATTHAVPFKNVLRADVCKESYDRTAILANAPEQDGECYVVPQVVE